MSNDAGILHQGPNLCLIKGSNFVQFEIFKCSSEFFPLFQNCQPAQACLETLEGNLLKQVALSGELPTPLVIVVVDVDLVVCDPAAALSVRRDDVPVHSL